LGAEKRLEFTERKLPGHRPIDNDYTDNHALQTANFEAKSSSLPKIKAIKNLRAHATMVDLNNGGVRYASPNQNRLIPQHQMCLKRRDTNTMTYTTNRDSQSPTLANNNEDIVI
jgi:hypothetical protein